ncbi:Alg12p [Microsporum canis CBS 113480]|uniref:Mannosyltransferase n=1 Tax=Arthroderma otae (strain ATCC MYA-4605 / CBS 113480) TaxID=554155 RepID=C5FEI8_ARTOC|nr:Alg12p [Microsporum canis CBS 113480]EEQ28222.1 Alg12p [Microsporum canis CBS 113480]
MRYTMLAYTLIISCLVGSTALAFLWLSPFTKVEESFNIQAVHDILKYGVPSVADPLPVLNQYDHVSFPGSVPRTFVGAVLLAGISQPIIWLTKGNPQAIVRGVLWFFNSLALGGFARAILMVFGSSTGIWYILLQSSQFHIMYYASRTLPNMFALPITTFAYTLFVACLKTSPQVRISRRYRLCLYLLTVAGVIFRSEIAVLLGTTTIYLWAQGRIGLHREIIPAGIGGLLIGLTTTVLVDSFFWQEFPLWPELAGFVYNVLQGKASNWGTDPWYYYFTSALPRLLFNPLVYLVCIPFACVAHPLRQAARSIVIPLVAFIAIMSFQPHKEWRFIIYSIPPFTGVAALGASYIWSRRAKSIVYCFLSIFLILSTLASYTVSFFVLLPISMSNYPGGAAMKQVHSYAHGSQAVITVHMDTLTCQTGATHFLEMPIPESPMIHIPGSNDGKFPELKSGESSWIYDKTENELEKRNPKFWEKIDYALVEDEAILSGMGNWELVDNAYGYDGIRIIRPGTGDCYACGAEAVILRALFGDTGVDYWESIKASARKYITRGWWVEARVTPKIRIMKHLR